MRDHLNPILLRLVQRAHAQQEENVLLTVVAATTSLDPPALHPPARTDPFLFHSLTESYSFRGRTQARLLDPIIAIYGYKCRRSAAGPLGVAAQYHLLATNKYLDEKWLELWSDYSA